jgi:hypothetical protein
MPAERRKRSLAQVARYERIHPEADLPWVPLIKMLSISQVGEAGEMDGSRGREPNIDLVWSWVRNAIPT